MKVFLAFGLALTISILRPALSLAETSAAATGLVAANDGVHTSNSAQSLDAKLYPTLGSVEIGDASKEERGIEPRASSSPLAALLIADLSYHPASSTASLELRQASWRVLRIMDVNEDGGVLRNGLWLSDKEAGRYYRNAGAIDSLQLNRRGFAHHIQASIWTWVPVPVGTVLLAFIGGAIANGQYGTPNPDGTYNYSQNTIAQKEGQDALVGAAIGLALGAALGAPMAISYHHRTEEDFHEAADRFNLKLLRDLKLRAVPAQGGGKIGIDKAF